MKCTDSDHRGCLFWRWLERRTGWTPFNTSYERRPSLGQPYTKEDGQKCRERGKKGRSSILNVCKSLDLDFFGTTRNSAAEGEKKRRKKKESNRQSPLIG
jgi:hypothetical protein